VPCHWDAPRICAPRKLLTAVQQTRVENRIHEEISQIVVMARQWSVKTAPLMRMDSFDEVQFKGQFRSSKVEFRVILSNMLDINGGKLVDNVGLPLMNLPMRLVDQALVRLVSLAELTVQFNARPIRCAVQYSLCLFHAIFISRYMYLYIYMYVYRYTDRYRYIDICMYSPYTSISLFSLSLSLSLSIYIYIYIHSLSIHSLVCRPQGGSVTCVCVV
jgi:hypothetical protein